MGKIIESLLRGECGNQILPFLWMHGEEESVIRREIGKIHESNIASLCVEARPHPDYCGEGWWHDLGIVIDEAKKYEMKVWILDDAHFPTGYANGIIARKHPERSKQYLKMAAIDVAGPMPQCTLDISQFLIRQPSMNPMKGFMGAGLLKPELPDDDFLLTLVAGRVGRNGGITETIELTGNVSDNMLCWDVPSGLWKIFVLTVTREGDGRDGYINWIDERSAECQIEGVYEPHWEQLKNDFGETIAGFFSDEPEIGNTIGYNFDEDIGKKMMPLMYSDELAAMLCEKLGPDWKISLPMLWYLWEDGKDSAYARKTYMDCLTKLVKKNFSEKLSAWCHSHHVEYIGHVIEDNNQHTRLGCGMGHYFRSTFGMDMAGIDDIGNQVVFGGENSFREGGFSRGDGEFYHFALGKLGSSMAHIDPKKHGRTMCEIFGAYGWDEGTRLMKYLADHFMLRGVNYFVPHAFSPMKFPDPDCPPHFFAGGNNPMFRPFGHLMQYMNRICTLISHGEYQCRVAVLYNAEASWMGESMQVQKPARVLLENQIGFDIIPCDILENENDYGAKFREGILSSSGALYDTLIIPGCEYIPGAAAEFLKRAAGTGFRTIFAGNKPKAVIDGDSSLIDYIDGCELAELSEISELLADRRDVELSETADFIRSAHYSGENEIYLLNNESCSEIFDGIVSVRSAGIPLVYDAFLNRLMRTEYSVSDGVCNVRLRIEPYNMAVLIMADCLPDNVVCQEEYTGKSTEIHGFEISYASADEYPHFSGREKLENARNISALHPDFSGTIRYECSFFAGKIERDAAILLPEAYEFAEAWLNGTKIGSRIAPAYIFACTDAILEGENRLVIEVTNTLAHRFKPTVNSFSAAKMLEPSGLLANPMLIY